VARALTARVAKRAEAKVERSAEVAKEETAGWGSAWAAWAAEMAVGRAAVVACGGLEMAAVATAAAVMEPGLARR